MRIMNWGSIAIGLFALAASAVAAQPEQDQIQVVGHIVLGNGPVTRLMATEHYGKCYLYAEHAGNRTVSVIDVSENGQPKVVSEFGFPANGRDDLIAVAGTEAVVADQPVRAPAPQTVKVMDVRDPEHPTVQREFDSVTAISRDNQRGLIFLANGDGVWILRQQLAEDPALVKAYDNYVLYNR